MSRDRPVEPGEGRGGDEGDSGEELGRIEEYLVLSPSELDALQRAGRQPAASGGEPVEGVPEKTEHNLRHDRYDERLYSELHEASSELRDLEASEVAAETFPALLSDFFLTFYKAEPTLSAEDEVEEASLRANRPFVERLLEDETTSKARIHTRLDDMASALAALGAGEKVLKEISERPELADYVREQSKPPDDEDEQSPEDGEQPGPEGEEAGEAEGQASSTPKPPPRDLRRAVRAAAEAASEEAEDLHDTLAGWGLAPADLRKAPLGERLKLARRLRGPDLKRLMDLVGRMRNLAGATAREQVRQRRDEVHSIELSGDPARMLPAELSSGLGSGSAARRLDFYRRFVEGEVLSYELTATERVGKGPVLAAIDCSASMRGYPMEWATAVALGMVEIASGTAGKDRRPAAVCFFNTQVVKTVRFEPGERDPRKLLDVATVEAGGGTAYEPAIEGLFDLAGESAHQGADLLLVTDALCRLSDGYVEWLADEKRRLSASLYSVLIGGDKEQGKRELGRYSDAVWTVSGLSGPGGADSTEAAGELFARL